MLDNDDVINLNGRKDKISVYFNIHFEYISFYWNFLANRYVAGRCPYPTSKFPNVEGDCCGKWINAVEFVDTKCQICHSTPQVKTSEHLFRATYQT